MSVLCKFSLIQKSVRIFVSGITALTFNEKEVAGVFGKFGLESAHKYHYATSVINTFLIYLVYPIPVIFAWSFVRCFPDLFYRFTGIAKHK